LSINLFSTVLTVYEIKPMNRLFLELVKSFPHGCTRKCGVKIRGLIY
jgi:hypothetical protein